MEINFTNSYKKLANSYNPLLFIEKKLYNMGKIWEDLSMDKVKNAKDGRGEFTTW